MEGGRDVRMERCKCRRWRNREGCKDGKMERGWKDRRMEGWREGRMEGWRENKTTIHMRNLKKKKNTMKKIITKNSNEK